MKTENLVKRITRDLERLNRDPLIVEPEKIQNLLFQVDRMKRTHENTINKFKALRK
jgi:hypothetical protein